MRTLLIADRSDDLCVILKQTLQTEFQVTTCMDGITAKSLILHMQPDALILDLSLPHLDGLSLLEDLAGHLPGAVLATTDDPSGYVHQMAVDRGAGHVMMQPFHTRSARNHILGLLEYTQRPNPRPADPQSIAAAHLSKLGLDSALDGYQQLRIGIPLFAQDPALRLGKELYSVIITLWHKSNPTSIERNIRTAIVAAWKQRDKAVWDVYCPGLTKCPSNKKFIAQLAQFTNPPE